MKLVLRAVSTFLVVVVGTLLAWKAAPPPRAPIQDIQSLPAGAIMQPGTIQAAGSIVLAGRGQPVRQLPIQIRHPEFSGYTPSNPDAPWAPPEWFGSAEALLAIGQMDEPGPRSGPAVRSRSVFVFDVDAGQVLFEKNADNIRPVASMTKLVSSLALASAEPNLERIFCVGAEQYPTRNGALSKLSTGDCVTGWDTLGAALVASDNRAAFGMAAAAEMDLDSFIERMNSVSADLGMSSSSWSDPSGLEDENLSTARDMAKATLAVATHPVLSQVASAPFWDLHRTNRNEPRRLFSTDRLAGREDIVVEAAKTGYTDTARYCFTTLLTTETGRRLVITLMGAEGKMTRWGDIERILSWLEQ
jgi:D-alanyl-D-alanine endopeptidase (penicillin-binding protein 7)